MTEAGSMPTHRIKQRSLTIAEQRQQAAARRKQNLNYGRIAELICVNPIRARDLCKQYERYPKLSPPECYRFELSKRAVLSLLNGKYAQKMEANFDFRLKQILEIAVSYRKSELLTENLC